MMTSLRLPLSIRRNVSSVAKAVCAISLAALSASTASAHQGTFISQDGLLVIPFERADYTGSWNLSTSTPGYGLDGYIRWDGPNLFGSPGTHGVFRVEFELDQGGQWILALRNRHEHPDPTEDNDVWVRVDGGQWIKVFSNAPSSVGNWTWESRFDLHGSFPQANYNLSAGPHVIEFSGRSHGFKMDRFHLHRPGAPGATDLSQPESPRRFGTNFCNATTNSTGSVGSLEALGSPIVANEDVVIEGRNLPPGEFGIFIMSDTTMNGMPFPGNNGNLCLGGNYARNANPGRVLLNGRTYLTLDLTNPAMGAPAIQPGETRHFQFWHRDGHNSANATRGLTLLFE